MGNCMCGDRKADKCPGEWEPGCEPADLKGKITLVKYGVVATQYGKSSLCFDESGKDPAMYDTKDEAAARAEALYEYWWDQETPPVYKVVKITDEFDGE